jgi:RNA polymerase sigma-70 factor (ECF subfamily)
MFRVVVNATNVINMGPAGNREAPGRQECRPRYEARRAMNALALSSCGAGFTRQPVGLSRAVEIRKLSCLPGGVLPSNGSDMAVYKAQRPADGSAESPSPAPRGSEMSDTDICQALAAGEAWAAEVIYDRVEDVVDAVLFRLMGAGDGERDDLAQQSLERIISTIVSGRFSHGCSLRSWATLITQHIAIDAMRSRTRERKLFDRSVGPQALELVAEDTRTPERAAETNRRVERLLGALSTVNRARAEAVILHDILGHDLAEIARLTGVSVAAAQSRLVRGRKEVLRFIEGKEQ